MPSLKKSASLGKTRAKIIVSDNSMAPLLFKGDVVSFKKTSFLQIVTNDIVVIKKNNKHSVHRVIYKTKDYLITMGDNFLKTDGNIYPKDVVGRVNSVKRKSQLINPEDMYLLQSTIYFQEIIKLKNVLETNKIDYVFLKGLPLHLYYFNKIPRRIYADCDLLIAQKEKEIANTVLSQLGFVQKNMENFKNVVTFFNSTPKEVDYVKSVNNHPIVFDVHFKISLAGHIITLPNNISLHEETEITKRILKSKRFVKIKGETIPVLEPNLQIFYLLLHFSKHKWHGMHYLELIAKLIKETGEQIDWKKIVSLGKKFGVLNFVMPSLYLLQKHFNAIPPSEFAKLFKIGNGRFSVTIYRFLFSKMSVFENEDMYIDRLRKGIITFLFLNENFPRKLFRFLHPSFLAHSLLLSLSMMPTFFQNKKRAIPSWRDYYR